MLAEYIKHGASPVPRDLISEKKKKSEPEERKITLTSIHFHTHGISDEYLSTIPFVSFHFIAPIL